MLARLVCFQTLSILRNQKGKRRVSPLSFFVAMSARCLLVALFCFSAAVAYGPAMILSHAKPYLLFGGGAYFDRADEVYINKIIDYSDLEPLVPIEVGIFVFWITE